jgi:NADH-quinone oxidoreductase subunit N
MRNELLLIGVAVFVLITDLNYEGEKRKQFLHLALGVFLIAVVIGFLPASSGSLFGDMYHTDPIKVLMKNILNVSTFLVLLQSYSWLSGDHQKGRSGEYILLLISTLIGMGYMISSTHFLMFYLGLELATIPLAALAAFESYKSKSAEAGIKFILLASFSSAILLFGLSLLYATGGSMYFQEVMINLNPDSITVLGMIFFFAGLAFKISLVPFHLWAADVYEGAPINVTSYLSVVSKGSALFIFVIVFFTVFSQLEEVWDPMVYTIAILTMFIGNLFALRQKNIKRFLAFSSIAQAGFIMLGVIGNSELGLTAVIYFMFVYLFSNLAAFGVASAISSASGKELIEDYNGLYSTNPRLSLIMMLAMFSLAGIPPVAGFFGKFFLFTAAAEKGYFVLVFIALINATISLYYYLLVIKAMFINKSDNPITSFKSDLPMRISLIVCVVGILAAGFTNQVFDYFIKLSDQFFSQL